MFDIGWSELLVIAIVLIVVVGPKDLPPMIRAFGKTMAGLRKMAGDFRTQFDDALKEADMDDVRQTISDVRNLNPTNSLRDAMNPLRQLGNDIRSDLQGAATPPASPATSAPAGAPAVSLSEPEMKLPDGPPPTIATEAAVAGGVATAAPATVSTAAVAPSISPAEKPKTVRKRAPAKSTQEVEAETVAAKPKRAAKTVSAKTEATKTASAEPVAPKSSKPAALTEASAKASKVKAAKATVEAGKPVIAKAKALVEKAETEKTAALTPAKPMKTAKTKKGEA
ncbi:Sec-independent protein translocase protein TatB [Agrobacterium vaccinii]|uniref:Sec-independent protein translocase protein TatB n=1 Tax=Agrobacterium vaccinii TaxID=2735528 RepID=UPI001E2BAA99|nr:Sec-independent protein translocase protein TatB [Agrobacterium vaccinii]UHS58090.1 twin-arginine translocase subunit TatB [Agrobacterium vaccinii]